MAKIQPKILNIGESADTDVVGYRIRVAKADVNVDYDTAYTEVTATAVDVSTLPGLADVDDIFDFYISAVDDQGNESDFAIALGVPVDFLAPTPPSGITF